MAHKKISPTLEKEVLVKAAEGWSSRRIAAWLGTDHSVKVSHVAVAALLRQTRETREDVAAAVTREALRPHVTSDLGRIEEIRVEVASRRQKATRGKNCSHMEFARLAALELEVLEKKLKLAGAGGGSADGERAGVRVFLPPEE